MGFLYHCLRKSGKEAVTDLMFDFRLPNNYTFVFFSSSIDTINFVLTSVKSPMNSLVIKIHIRTLLLIFQETVYHFFSALSQKMLCVVLTIKRT